MALSEDYAQEITGASFTQLKALTWRDRTHVRTRTTLSTFEALLLDGKVAKDEYDIQHLRPHATEWTTIAATLPPKVRGLLEQAERRLR